MGVAPDDLATGGAGGSRDGSPAPPGAQVALR
jgi:hypothetical protein